MADSFAIAAGGATFYRNRVNSLLEKSGFKKPQVIFLTGAAGSGKTTAAKNFGKNWVIVNKDVEMEALMKEAGLPSDLNKLTREQRGEWQKIQEQASKNALAEIKKLKEQGKNIIIDDTGSSEATTSRLKRELEKSGYESKMLLLGTSLEQSLERNKARKQRTLTDVTVKNSFEALMGNKKRYKEVFKDNFIEATDGKISDNLISELTGKISRKDAEAQAFEDFSEISEETQQSGDPALISSDQASTAGRLLLAFQNTPVQLNRSIKKAAQDIYNRRRTPGQTQAQSDFSNFSKIIYYGAIQNVIFTALSNALFALIPGFDDEELTEEGRAEMEKNKVTRMANGIVDTTLKGGFGLPGAAVATIKNVVMEYIKQDKKGFTADHTYTILQAANLAPPIGSKLGKIYKGIQTKRFDKEVIQGRGWDVTIDGKFNLSPQYSVLGQWVEGATNVPLARAVDEINSITEAFDARNTVMQRIALSLGWRQWDVGTENEENDLVEVIVKSKKKAAKKKENALKRILKRNNKNKK
jgi:predicted kinase